jgi:hypothetical protein
VPAISDQTRLIGVSLAPDGEISNYEESGSMTAPLRALRVTALEFDD